MAIAKLQESLILMQRAQQNHYPVFEHFSKRLDPVEYPLHYLKQSRLNFLKQ